MYTFETLNADSILANLEKFLMWNFFFIPLIMQNWTRAFWSILPLISAFFLLQVGIQLLFIWQLSGSISLEKLFSALAQNALLYGFFWTFSAAVSRVFSTHEKRVNRSFYVSFCFFLIGSIACDQYFLRAHEALDETILLFDWRNFGSF